MGRKSSELKQIARAALLGNYSAFAACYLLYLFIAGIVEAIPNSFIRNTRALEGMILYILITWILICLTEVLAAGFIKICLNISRGESFTVQDLFFAYRNHPDRYIIIYFLLSLICLVCSSPSLILSMMMYSRILPTTYTYLVIDIILGILSLVVMIVITLNYIMSDIILTEDSEIGALAAMQASSKMMQGQKGRCFYLLLSFIGMGFLVVLSFGIASFWVVPYMNTTRIEFYRDITGELDLPPLTKEEVI